MENQKQIESIYIMKSPEAWDRFMRFMERYGETNGLVFTKATLRLFKNLNKKFIIF